MQQVPAVPRVLASGQGLPGPQVQGAAAVQAMAHGAADTNPLGSPAASRRADISVS